MDEDASEVGATEGISAMEAFSSSEVGATEGISVMEAFSLGLILLTS